LPPLDAGAEVVLEEAGGKMGRLHRRLEHPPGAAAALLGVVEGKVGAAEQRLVFAGVVERGDADRGRNLDTMSAGEHRRQAGEDPTGEIDRRLGLRRRMLKDGELVAAQAGDKVARLDQAAKKAGGLDEELVTDGMAEEVVGVLEA